MSPDEEHEIYYNGHPMGNHPEPATETIRFMERQQDFNEKIGKDITDIKLSLIRIEDVGKSTLTQAERTNGRVDKLEEFSPMLREIEEERQAMKENTRTWVWELIKFVSIGFVGGVIALMGLKIIP